LPPDFLRFLPLIRRYSLVCDYAIDIDAAAAITPPAIILSHFRLPLLRHFRHFHFQIFTVFMPPYFLYFFDIDRLSSIPPQMLFVFHFH
jgi:hypothetical protein